MTVMRVVFLLAYLASLSLAIIEVRSAQARSGARIADYHQERTELRRRMWTLQMEMSRLRSPRQIRDRVARWSLDIKAPGPPRPSEVSIPHIP